jgi:glycine cleavage system H protein
VIVLGKKYVLPCAGYDRPGGTVSRFVVDLLQSMDSSIVIGSIGALSAKRPGEVKYVRSSNVICIDGCSMKCASKMIENQGPREFESVEVTQIPESDESIDEKAKAVVDIILKLWNTKPSESMKIVETETIEPEDEYLTEMIDKFILKVKRRLFYSDNDFWVEKEGELMRIGATDLLQQMVSDIYFIDLVDDGTQVGFGDELGSFESTKIAMEIISPLTGTVVERNIELENSPELINEDPYGKGWLYVIRPDDISELDLLKTANEYLFYGVEKAKHELGKKVPK